MILRVGLYICYGFWVHKLTTNDRRMQFIDTLSIHTCVARENTQLLRIGQAENMDLCIGSSSGNKSIFRSMKPARRVQLLIRCGSDGRLFRLVGMRGESTKIFQVAWKRVSLAQRDYKLNCQIRVLWHDNGERCATKLGNWVTVADQCTFLDAIWSNKANSM
jgi:hypothetical protein